MDGEFAEGIHGPFQYDQNIKTSDINNNGGIKVLISVRHRPKSTVVPRGRAVI